MLQTGLQVKSCTIVTAIHFLIAVRLILTDPRLAFAMLFGPSAPTHYRVMGHGAWPGARESILTIMDRIAVPLKTRKSPENGQSSAMIYLFVFLAIALCLLAISMSQ